MEREGEREVEREGEREGEREREREREREDRETEREEKKREGVQLMDPLQRLDLKPVSDLTLHLAVYPSSLTNVRTLAIIIHVEKKGNQHQLTQDIHVHVKKTRQQFRVGSRVAGKGSRVAR